MTTTTVLVHGGCASAGTWGRVVPLLKARGVDAIALTLPSCLPSAELDDVEAVRAVLDGMDGPAVLVAHSYGGLVVSEVGDHPAVTQLLYLDALVPEIGDSIVTHMREVAGGFAACYRTSDNGTGWFDPEALSAYLISQGWSTTDASEMLQTMGPQRWEATLHRTTQTAWRNVPTTYVSCTDSEMPSASRQLFAERIPNTIEMPGDHFPHWLRPREVADIIASIAQDVDSVQARAHR
jgi:pimeloyl-ACP methyl ester carboxylesterase